MGVKAIVRFGKYLSERVGVDKVEIFLDKCVTIRELLELLCSKYPNLDKDSLIVLSNDRILPLPYKICEDIEVEIIDSVLGG